MLIVSLFAVSWSKSPRESRVVEAQEVVLVESVLEAVDVPGWFLNSFIKSTFKFQKPFASSSPQSLTSSI
jgi:hypothetical protein